MSSFLFFLLYFTSLTLENKKELREEKELFRGKKEKVEEKKKI